MEKNVVNQVSQKKMETDTDLSMLKERIYLIIILNQ